MSKLHRSPPIPIYGSPWQSSMDSSLMAADNARSTRQKKRIPLLACGSTLFALAQWQAELQVERFNRVLLIELL